MVLRVYLRDRDVSVVWAGMTTRWRGMKVYP